MLKKLAKVVGFMAGAAAVLWAMRDRFISVATSREPETPTFRITEVEDSPGVETVNGIGPVFARRLEEAGIDNMSKLATASPDSVAEAAAVSSARARTWIELAQQQT